MALFLVLPLRTTRVSSEFSLGQSLPICEPRESESLPRTDNTDVGNSLFIARVPQVEECIGIYGALRSHPTPPPSERPWSAERGLADESSRKNIPAIFEFYMLVLYDSVSVTLSSIWFPLNVWTNTLHLG